ncbi:hypothetical protein PtA15_9A289 [Puccinia triticina]|uniref:Uncharacterized protein n=1 Tax=Puccinia triticina TaxID=208348 RepID=A0ABY7CU68_9BASI|nr:uncharacterized protein PtA15_9A289 [Puccinia triticina]WAQ88164.1 hypothetical protein PtA15_9A289 [Puccinia triticina]
MDHTLSPPLLSPRPIVTVTAGLPLFCPLGPRNLAIAFFAWVPFHPRVASPFASVVTTAPGPFSFFIITPRYNQPPPYP